MTNQNKTKLEDERDIALSCIQYDESHACNDEHYRNDETLQRLSIVAVEDYTVELRKQKHKGNKS